MVVTAAVLNELTSTAGSVEQPSNMLRMVVTADVLRLPMPWMEVSFEQFWNHRYVFVSCTAANEGSNTTVVNVPFTMPFHAGVSAEVVTAVPLHTLVMVTGSVVPSGVNAPPAVSEASLPRK